jgi:hypothetical protein
MFGDNIIPDDIVYGFYDKKYIVDLSNNIDISNNKITSNSHVNIDLKTIRDNLAGGFIDEDHLCYFIAPIDNEGNMIKRKR